MPRTVSPAERRKRFVTAPAPQYPGCRRPSFWAILFVHVTSFCSASQELTLTLDMERADVKESSFVTSHRIAMTSPGPQQRVAASHTDGLKVALAVALERWPVVVDHGRSALIVPIQLDGHEEQLSLPFGNHSGEARTTTTTTSISTTSVVEARKAAWSDIVRDFCALHRLNADNHLWLSERVADLEDQISGGAVVGTREAMDGVAGNDTAIVAGTTLCLTLRRANDASAHDEAETEAETAPLHGTESGQGAQRPGSRAWHSRRPSPLVAAAQTVCAAGSHEMEFRFPPPLESGRYELGLSQRRTAGRSHGRGPELQDLPSAEPWSLPGSGDVDLRSQLTVTSSSCREPWYVAEDRHGTADGAVESGLHQSAPVIAHPHHGTLLGSTVALEIFAVTNDEDEDGARARGSHTSRGALDGTRRLCLSLDGKTLSNEAQPPAHPCFAWPFEQDAYLRELSPGRHRLEAWWSRQDAYLQQEQESHMRSRGGRAAGKAEEEKSEFYEAPDVRSGGPCRASVEFEVSSEGPTMNRSRALALGSRRSTDEHESNDDDFNAEVYGDEGGGQTGGSNRADSSPQMDVAEGRGTARAKSRGNETTTPIVVAQQRRHQPLEGGAWRRSPEFVFVTGASQRYYNEGILQNLIGSIHYWEGRPVTLKRKSRVASWGSQRPTAVSAVPSAVRGALSLPLIEVFDFGLSAACREDVASWASVRLRRLPGQRRDRDRGASDDSEGESGGGEPPLPEHLLAPATGAYAAKPWATRDALRRCERRGDGRGCTVLWIDANAELRRPVEGASWLAELEAAGNDRANMDRNHRAKQVEEPEKSMAASAFFVTHPYEFPNPQFHHPSALRHLGCSSDNSANADPWARWEPSMATMPHCATTFMGFSTASSGGRAAVEGILEPLVACALDEPCVYPPGSNRSNHRQEQTALNAILCNLRKENMRRKFEASTSIAALAFDGSLHSSDAMGTLLNRNEGIRNTGRDIEGDVTDEMVVAFMDSSMAAEDPLAAESLCADDIRFRLTSDFENRHSLLQPSEDPTTWNELRLYTRRRHPTKPYAPFLRRRPASQ